jgi:type IV pilus assembly protein PilE
VTRTKASIRVAGFTLVELVIVMVIVAILAAIAIPSYQSQIRKSRRTDAKTAVLDLAAREEKYFSLNNSYTSSPVNLGYGTATSFPQNVNNGYYQVYVCAASTAGSTSTNTGCTAASTATGTSYVVAAIPVTGTTQASDSSCQYFAVDNTGTQFASSIAGIGTDTTSTCWQ